MGTTAKTARSVKWDVIIIAIMDIKSRTISRTRTNTYSTRVFVDFFGVVRCFGHASFTRCYSDTLNCMLDRHDGRVDHETAILVDRIGVILAGVVGFHVHHGGIDRNQSGVRQRQKGYERA